MTHPTFPHRHSNHHQSSSGRVRSRTLMICILSMSIALFVGHACRGFLHLGCPSCLSAGCIVHPYCRRCVVCTMHALVGLCGAPTHIPHARFLSLTFALAACAAISFACGPQAAGSVNRSVVATRLHTSALLGGMSRGSGALGAPGNEANGSCSTVWSPTSATAALVLVLGFASAGIRWNWYVARIRI